MFGKHHSDERKRYLSELASKQWSGVPKTEEWKKNIGLANKNNIRSDLSSYNKKTKAHRIIFEDTIFISVREAMRCTQKSQKWIQDRAVKL